MARDIRKGTDDTKTETRARFEYRESNSLEIPEHVREEFLKEGFRLRWVRYRIGTEEDLNNISKHMRDGMTFVTPQEGASLVQAMFLPVRDGSDKITNGDLVLCKVPVHMAEARREFYDNKQRETERANAIMLGKESRQNGAQLSNNSRSTVRTGRNANFAQDE